MPRFYRSQQRSISSLPPIGTVTLYMPKDIKELYGSYTIDESKYEKKGLIYGGMPSLHKTKYERNVRFFRFVLQLENFNAFEESILLIETILQKENNLFFPCWVASVEASAEDESHYYPALSISFFLPLLKSEQIFPSNAHIKSWIEILSFYLTIKRIAVKKPDTGLYFIVPESDNLLGFRQGYDENKDLSPAMAFQIAQAKGNPIYNPYGEKKMILGFPNGLTLPSALTGKMLYMHESLFGSEDRSTIPEHSTHTEIAETTSSFSFPRSL